MNTIILMGLTSHDQLDNTDTETGLWLEELAHTPVLSKIDAEGFDAIVYPGGHVVPPP
jgi:hypothetical protein